ncbi:MAG TPA: hypothetical protein VN824_22375, partial [Puia sp.]|nr:hypothetical protein [Puia sp.]
MSDQQPSYYQKYLALGDLEMDMAFFLDLFERFNGRDWEKFLLDLLLEEPYPDLMMKYRKGFSALAYYSGILSSLPNIVKKEVENTLLKIALPLLADRSGNAEKILLRQLELAKLMTRGLPVSVITDHLLAPEETSPLVKTRAAMTLAFYEEEEAERFWRYEAKKRLPSQSVLAIPRFLALKEKDMPDALESLIYAEPAENISRLEWNYHFEKIIEIFSLEKDQWSRLNGIYQRFPSWIKTIFNESLAASEEEEYLQLRTYLHSNGFMQEDLSKEGAPPHLLQPDHLLTPIYIAEVDGLRPFDQDYFIDYAEKLDFFRVHGFRLVREKYKDYPHSLEVLNNKEEIAILPRPRSFLTNEFKTHVRGENMSIAI